MRQAIINGEIQDAYYVTPDGRFFSEKSGTLKEISVWVSKCNPYPRVTFCHQSKKRYYLAHRVVCETYKPKPIPKFLTQEEWGMITPDIRKKVMDYCCQEYQVNHIDHNILNRHIDNLEWVTGKENIKKYHIHNNFVTKFDKIDRLIQDQTRISRSIHDIEIDYDPNNMSISELSKMIISV